MEAANMAGGGGRVVPAHPHPHPPPHPLYMPHLAIKPPHPTLGIFTQLEKIHCLLRPLPSIYMFVAVLTIFVKYAQIFYPFFPIGSLSSSSGSFLTPTSSISSTTPSLMFPITSLQHSAINSSTLTSSSTTPGLTPFL